MWKKSLLFAVHSKVLNLVKWYSLVFRWTLIWRLVTLALKFKYVMKNLITLIYKWIDTYEILDGYKKQKKCSYLRICPERSKIDLPCGYSSCGINLKRMKNYKDFNKQNSSNITNKNTELPSFTNESYEHQIAICPQHKISKSNGKLYNVFSYKANSH